MNLITVYSNVIKNSVDRRQNDFYPTPPLATYVLNSYYTLPDNIIEPCAGRGHISKELIRQGHNVKSFDLYEYEDTFTDVTSNTDFMSLPKQIGYDGLITNPPYHKGLPLKMLSKAIDQYDFVAFFLRLTFLEGKSRKSFFDLNPPSSILFLSDRIRFSDTTDYPIDKKDQIGGMIAYMWIIYDKKNNLDKFKWVSLSEHYDDWRSEYDRSKVA